MPSKKTTRANIGALRRQISRRLCQVCPNIDPTHKDREGDPLEPQHSARS